MNKFIFLVFASFLIFASLPSASAQTKKTMVSVQEQTASKNVDYALPYPGILPDHPLYLLKAGRDRIMDFLIVDPVRKAEFYILMADKRLGMAMMLLDKGNTALSETTLSKSQAYMDKAVSTTVNYGAGGKKVPEYLADRLTRSLAKHIEVLSERGRTENAAQLMKLQTGMTKVQ